MRAVAANIGFQKVIVCIAIDQKVGVISIRFVTHDFAVASDFFARRKRRIVIEMNFIIAKQSEELLPKLFARSFAVVIREHNAEHSHSAFVHLTTRDKNAFCQWNVWSRQLHYSHSLRRFRIAASSGARSSAVMPMSLRCLRSAVQRWRISSRSFARLIHALAYFL